MILLDQKKHPNLFPLFQKEEIIALHKLRSISFELLSILGMKDNAVDFSYLNDQKGRAVIIPQVKSLPAFMEQARRMRGIDSLLDHIAGPGYDKDDAAEWLFYFLGKKNDAASTLALEALGLPLVNGLDDASAQAMWSESQKNAFIGVEMPL